MTIEERLTRLERENRTWRIGCAALALLAGAIASCSDSNDRQDAKAGVAATSTKPVEIPEVIRATRIEAATIVLRNIPDQQAVTLVPGMIVMEKEGKTRLTLLSGPNGGELQVYNSEGPNLAVADDKEKQKMPSVALKAGGNGGGNIVVRNAAGKNVAILQSSNNDVGVLYTFDERGENPKAFGP